MERGSASLVKFILEEERDHLPEITCQKTEMDKRLQMKITLSIAFLCVKFIERRLETGEMVRESQESLSAGFVVDTKPDKELHKVDF